MSFDTLFAFQSAASSLKTAGEIVKALIGMKITAEVQAKVIELQGVILAAQSGAMDAQASQVQLLDRVRELEDELVKFKDWEAEKQRYGLVRDSGGCMIYALKQTAVDAGEAPHAICPNCYENGKKSFLQPAPDGARAHGAFCPQCNAAYRVWGPPDPAPG